MNAWCFEPALESDPDSATHPRLSPLPRSEHAEQTVCFALSPGLGNPGACHGYSLPPLRRHRCPQEQRRRLRPLRRPPRQGLRGDPHLLDHDRRPAGPGGLADRPRRHARGDGIDRRLLEAGLQHPGGRRLRHSGQRRAHQEGARPQDGRQGLPVDRPVVAARLAPRQFRAAATNPRAAGPDPAADAVDPGTVGGGQPHPEGAGGRQHQAGRRGDGRARRLGPGHARSLDRRGDRPREAGRPGASVCERRSRRCGWRCRDA